MANSYIQSIEQATQFVRDHKDEWESVDRTILQIAKNAQKIGVSDVDGSIKELNARIQQNTEFRKQMNQQVQEQEKLIKSLRAEIERTNKAQSSTRKGMTDEERLAKKVEASKRRLNEVRSEEWKTVEKNRKAANEEAKAVRSAGSAYAEASMRLTQITKEYKDLAIRKAQANNLTAEEIKRMDMLEKEIDTLRPKLVQIDQRVGQFGRSVGSYGKQFDSLSFNINQVTRELPAFAYGAQIGIAALSNNIPMLIDEIVDTRKQVALLRKEGKATQGTFARIAKSLLSWQTLLSLTVTLVTVFGSELGDAANELFDFSSDAEKAAKELERLNKVIEDNVEGLDDLTKARLEGTKSAQEELATLRLLDKTVKDVNETTENREKALVQLKKEYPGYLKNMSDEEIYAEGISDMYADMAANILRAARAKASFDKLVENEKSIQDISATIGVFNADLQKMSETLNTPQGEEFIKSYNDLQKAMEAGAEATRDGMEAPARALSELRRQYPEEAAALEGVNKLFGENIKSYKDVQTEITNLVNRRSELMSNNEKLADSINDVSDILDDNSKKTKNSSEKDRDKVESLNELNGEYINSISYHERMIARLEDEQSKVSRSSDEYDNFTKKIEEHRTAIGLIEDFKKTIQEELTMPTDELEAFNAKVVDMLAGGGIAQGLEGLSRLTGEKVEELRKQFESIYHIDLDQAENFYQKDFENFLKFSEAKMEQKDREQEAINEYQSQIVEEAIQLGNDLLEAEVEKIDRKIEENKDYYAQLLDNEELTEERRSALEAERDNKERKLLKEKRKREREQFLFEKAISLAKATINVAEAITEFGVISPQAILAGIVGALQIAQIAAQTVPKFEKGTENAPRGWAIVDEVRPEVHTDKHGNVKSFGSDKGSNLRFLDAGDKIYRSHEDYMKKQGLEGIEDNVWALNMKYQGRPVPQNDSNLALLGKVNELVASNERLGREMKRIASRPINVNNKLEFPDDRPY